MGLLSVIYTTHTSGCALQKRQFVHYGDRSLYAKKVHLNYTSRIRQKIWMVNNVSQQHKTSEYDLCKTGTDWSQTSVYVM